jgi:hypothetical protein
MGVGSPCEGSAGDFDRGIRLGSALPPDERAGRQARANTSLRVLSTLRSIRKIGNLRLGVRTATGGVVVIAAGLRPGGLAPTVGSPAERSS